MRCLNCNQIIADDNKFCPICGIDLKKFDGRVNEETGVYPVIQEDDARKRLLEALDQYEEDDVIDQDDLPELDKTIEIENVDNNLTDNEEEYDYSGVEVKDEYDNNSFDSVHEDLEKTIQVSFDNDDEFSLTGLINKQIEETNNAVNVEGEEAPTFVPIEEPVSSSSVFDEIKPYDPNEVVEVQTEELVETEETEDFDSDESVGKRKHTLVVAFIIMVIIIVGGFCALYYIENSHEDVKTVLTSNNTESVFNNYLNSNDDTELKSLLKDIRNDEEEVEKTQIILNRIIEAKIDDVIKGDYTSINEFNNEMTKVKNILTDIYAITDTNSSGTVRLINTSNYNDLIGMIEDGSNNAKPFFEALSYYNNKSYNESYTLFSKIESDSVYYNKAANYLTKIIDDVMLLINNDIAKLESGIDELSDDDKLIRYSQVQDVIIVYGTLYESLDLANNSDYQNVLNKYNDLVSQYS